MAPHGQPLGGSPAPSRTFDVKLGGRTASYRDEQGRYRVEWRPGHVVRGGAYDTPVTGYRSSCPGNLLLRLWKAEACASRSTSTPSTPATTSARRSSRKIGSETISKVLYPNDEPRAASGSAWPSNLTSSRAALCRT